MPPASASNLTSKLMSDRQRKRNAVINEMTFMTGNDSHLDNETQRIYSRITNERKEQAIEQEKKTRMQSNEFSLT